MSETIQYPLQLPDGWEIAPEGHVEVKLQPWAGVALLDMIDAIHLCHLNWYAHRRRNNVYARADVWAYGKRKTYPMHRLIMNAGPRQIVDHRSGNGLDNRRSNLRFATNSQNTANSRPRGRYSGFKGVSRDVRRDKWIAQIGHDYRHINIGSFDEELVAAAAYDIYAKALHGQFARSNLGVHVGVIA